MSYMKRTRTTPNGDVIEMSLFYTYREQPKDPKVREKRAPRTNQTPDAQKAANLRRSQNDVKMKLASNFQAGDCYMTLTLKPKAIMDTEGEIHYEPWSEEEAKKAWRSFYSRLMKYYKEHGDHLKYMGVMEISKSGKTVHFHIVFSASSQPDALEQIRRFWKHGFVDIKFYGGTISDAAKVAAYLKKKNENKIMSSKGLMKPIAKTEKVHRSEAWRPTIVAPKGYHVVKDDRCTWRGFTSDGYPMVMVTFERDRARGRYSNDDKRYRSEPERPKTRKRKKG